MRFKTIDEVLEWVVVFHRSLEQRYRAMAAGPVRERVKLLLDYLADHERALAGQLEAYRDQAPPRVLQTWHGRLADPVFPASLEELTGHLSEVETPTVLHTALQLHDQLIDLYHYLAETAQQESTMELFDNLLALEEHEKLRLVRDATRLEDY